MGCVTVRRLSTWLLVPEQSGQGGAGAGEGEREESSRADIGMFLLTHVRRAILAPVNPAPARGGRAVSSPSLVPWSFRPRRMPRAFRPRSPDAAARARRPRRAGARSLQPRLLLLHRTEDPPRVLRAHRAGPRAP